ncbi:MAG: hypothetical protein DRO62_02255 [Candidatus Altiarchaeales archaeon]|nr:MAG: hypothetical protein DRO62_02255 [Candidatus Altiarchaeales archaeon]
MKCSNCGQGIQKTWSFCPNCGIRLNLRENIEAHPPRGAEYLEERQEYYDLVFKNFKILRSMGDILYGEAEPVRPRLNDFGHINILNLRKFSLSCLSPEHGYTLYKIGKIIGHYLVNAGIRNDPKIGRLIDKLNKPEKPWNIFENKTLQKKCEEFWIKLGIGFIKLDDINREEGKLKYIVKECSSPRIHSTRPPCFMEMGILSGMAEALFGRFWDGIEHRCKSHGDPYSEIEIYLHDRKEEPVMELLTKDESNSILNEVVGLMVDRSEIRSDRIGDFFYIAIDQAMNYLLVALSPGHAILSKHCGKICGERISREAKLRGINDAFNYLRDLFLYSGVGIIRIEERIGRIIIKMDESIYASGVENIHMNLCISLAGFIEGALNEATDQKWEVTETKCIANGHPNCEFQCKLIT